MRHLIKSKEDFDLFCNSALEYHNWDGNLLPAKEDYDSAYFWMEISDRAIKNIHPPKSYPALLQYSKSTSNDSCWDTLHYEWITKEDLGL